MAEAVITVVTLKIGQQLLAHAFLLQAQGHHGIGPLKCSFEPTFHANPPAHRDRIMRLSRRRGIDKGLKCIGEQTWWPAEHHVCTTGGQGPEIGAGDTGVKDVPDDHDAFPLQRLGHRMLRRKMAGQRQQIQQALTGMAVQTIPPVEDDGAFAGTFQIVGQLLGHSCGAMTHHEHIRTHGDIGACRIENAFALAQRTAGRRKAHHVSRQPFGSKLETAAGACAGLKKKGGHQAPLQGRQLSGPSHRKGSKAFGRFENNGIVLTGERRQIKDVTVTPPTHAAVLPSGNHA